MRNQYNDSSYFDSQLKQLDKDIIWKESRKNKLEKSILFSMNSSRKKMRLVAVLKFASSIGILAIVLFFGYTFYTDSITYHDEASITRSEDSQIVDNHNPEVKVTSDDSVETDEAALEIHTGSVEAVTRKNEGMDQEVEVINYLIQPYKIAYQLDKVFGAPEVYENEIQYSIDDEYTITLAIIEDTNLDQSISNLQERFEAEGYDEEFELESVSSEENGFAGKMQYFSQNRVDKGFIAYEVGDDVLEITFRYPVEGGDGMYSILNFLRESIHLR
ncbi:hypothetical protein M3210_14265 [Oceanobacillus luteolus]|uniref:hypothetical protein n=1 Tax=Oceanobacillus luteolus TaxID=1274358 RepID=UPI00203C7C5D|nr:hypothetical protein [Oceanobacillus luteolus]MCM3741434.1 hypothetical protein [Oceanobacillus luteolus]